MPSQETNEVLKDKLRARYASLYGEDRWEAYDLEMDVEIERIKRKRLEPCKQNSGTEYSHRVRATDVVYSYALRDLEERAKLGPGTGAFTGGTRYRPMVKWNRKGPFRYIEWDEILPEQDEMMQSNGQSYASKVGAQSEIDSGGDEMGDDDIATTAAKSFIGPERATAGKSQAMQNYPEKEGSPAVSSTKPGGRPTPIKELRDSIIPLLFVRQLRIELNDVRWRTFLVEMLADEELFVAEWREYRRLTDLVETNAWRVARGNATRTLLLAIADGLRKRTVGEVYKRPTHLQSGRSGAQRLVETSRSEMVTSVSGQTSDSVWTAAGSVALPYAGSQSLPRTVSSPLRPLLPTVSAEGLSLVQQGSSPGSRMVPPATSVANMNGILSYSSNSPSLWHPQYGGLIQAAPDALDAGQIDPYRQQASMFGSHSPAQDPSPLPTASHAGLSLDAGAPRLLISQFPIRNRSGASSRVHPYDDQSLTGRQGSMNPSASGSQQAARNREIPSTPQPSLFMPDPARNRRVALNDLTIPEVSMRFCNGPQYPLYAITPSTFVSPGAQGMTSGNHTVHSASYNFEAEANCGNRLAQATLSHALQIIAVDSPSLAPSQTPSHSHVAPATLPDDYDTGGPVGENGAFRLGENAPLDERDWTDYDFTQADQAMDYLLNRQGENNSGLPDHLGTNSSDFTANTKINALYEDTDSRRTYG